MDRAFISLNKIKPHISVWWSSGGQATQLLKDGEVDLIGIWNGRVEAAIADGAKGAFTYNDGILIPDCLVIPKGSKRPEIAMKALALAVGPVPSAELTRYNNYGPVNMKAYDTGIISMETRRQLNSSPENMSSQVLFNGAWWADNGAAVLERWRRFVQQ